MGEDLCSSQNELGRRCRIRCRYFSISGAWTLKSKVAALQPELGTLTSQFWPGEAEVRGADCQQ
ncbi:hypothetical protein P7K49_003574, partial [Saguinus oedipus]